MNAQRASRLVGVTGRVEKTSFPKGLVADYIYKVQLDYKLQYRTTRKNIARMVV